MQKRLTLTIDEQVYEGLHKVIGARKISQFIEDLVRPHVVRKGLREAYKEMSDEEFLRGTEADGHFAFLEEPSEDVYTWDDGEEL